MLGRRGDLVIDDTEVSRRHAVIRPTDAGFQIEDLASLNGTQVDDVRIEGPAPLHDGSVIQIGQTTIRVRLQPAAQAVGQPGTPATSTTGPGAPTIDPHDGPGGPGHLGAADEARRLVSREVGDRPHERGGLEESPGGLGTDALGNYKLVSLIRRHETFSVYLGYQPSLDRYVAVKVLDEVREQEFFERFRLEARILARLHHPNIVPIYDQGEHSGRPYLVMQYLDNDVTLADMVGEPMEPIRALSTMAQVLRALEHAHQMGVIHRNVKPANVMMPLPMWPMLAGFDIAKLVSEEGRRGLTREGLILGTAAYVAPEQAFGLAVDGRTDVYSAGVVLFELLTGRLPFEGASPQDMLYKHAYQPPPRPSAFRPDLPTFVEPLLLKALAKEPPKRYQSAAAAAQALESAVTILERSRGSDPGTDLLKEGVEAFHRGQWERAIDRLSRLAQLDPGNDDAISLLQAARDSAEAG